MPGKFLYNIATKTCEENTGKSVNPLVFQWQPTIASANFPLETLPNNFLATLQKKDMEVPMNDQPSSSSTREKRAVETEWIEVEASAIGRQCTRSQAGSSVSRWTGWGEMADVRHLNCGEA